MSTRTDVVLPEPFGPSRPSTVPRRAEKSTPASAVVSANFLTLNFFIRPSAWMTDSMPERLRPGADSAVIFR